MTTTDATSGRRPTRSLLGLTSALLALQVLNLAVFDDLRTDPLVGAVETFTKPQHLSSILAVLLAVVLVALRHRVAARVAVVVAWVEIVTFTFFHGIPVEIGPSKPYWGDGMGTHCSGWASCRSWLAAQPSSSSAETVHQGQPQLRRPGSRRSRPSHFTTQREQPPPEGATS